MLGLNKDLDEAALNFGTSLVGGGIVNRIGTSLPPLKNVFEQNVVEFSMGTPTSVVTQIANKILIEKTLTQK